MAAVDQDFIEQKVDELMCDQPVVEAVNGSVRHQQLPLGGRLHRVQHGAERLPLQTEHYGRLVGGFCQGVS